MNQKILSNKLFIRCSAVSCLFILNIIFSSTSICLAFSLDKFSENFYKNNNNLLEYIVLLKNGDLISGTIIDCFINTDAEQINNTINTNNAVNKISDDSNIRKKNENIVSDEDFSHIIIDFSYIVIKTFAGEIIIYEDEIADIKEKKANILQNHSLYIMPTANPIGNNHFIGNYELVFLYGGIGLTDWVSITAGRSMLPFTNSNEQISIINAKVSIPAIVGTKNASNVVLAFGANLGWINTSNKMFHLFGIATFNSINKDFGWGFSSFSVGTFYKVGYQDYPSNVRLLGTSFNFDYQDGSFGGCLGFEIRMKKRKDLSILFECWNSDMENAANTALLLGLRLSREKLYADFGLSVFTLSSMPPVPFFSFVWMPFN